MTVADPPSPTDPAARPGPGRPRSERARAAVLKAADDLVDRDGFAALSVEAIAARAGVSKATIYRWWPNKAAVVMDAFVATTDLHASFPDTGSAREDLRLQIRSVIHLFTMTRSGRIIAGLIAESQHDPGLAEAFRGRLIAARRAAATEVFERGIRRGELRADVDADVAIDALYGALYYRLLVSGAPLDLGYADLLVMHVYPGLAATL